ncbi:MAG: glycoside hydrolase family 75 protein [Verrucomicrobiota bacterium]
MLRLPALALLAPALSSAQIELTEIESIPAGPTTSLRADGQGYFEKVVIRRPEALTKLDGLLRLNPALSQVLPALPELLASARVSDRFDQLYDRKIRYLQKGGQLTTHNFYDCATALLMQHPQSGRRLLWVQADMDVVTDGSDPVRYPELSHYHAARQSDWYLPQTAYQFGSTGGLRNPFLDYYPAAEKRLQHYRTLFEKEREADPGFVWRRLLEAVDLQESRLKTRHLSGPTRRSLLAQEDPFIVLSLDWFRGSGPWIPKMGDYAAVLYRDQIYPALLGEAGPTFKAGEASLRLAQHLNPQASGRVRAIDALEVSYLVFLQTAGPRQAPDLAQWHEKVAHYLEEIGGLGPGTSLHHWPPLPPKTPAKQPSVDPTR